MQQRRTPTPHGGVFSRTEARALGWTDAAIKHAVDSGRWRRLRPGVFAPSSAAMSTDRYDVARDEHLLAARATQRTSPEAVISHATAVIMHRLPLVHALRLPCLTVQSGTRERTLAATHLHRAGIGR